MNTIKTQKQSYLGDQSINSVFSKLIYNPVSNQNLKKDNKFKYSIQDTLKNFAYDGKNITESKSEFVKPGQTLEFNIPKKDLVVNKNTGVQYEDFPGMFGLKVPSPASLPNLGTGNGGGGQIISRSQIKNASEKARDSAGIELNDPNNGLEWQIKEKFLPTASSYLHYVNPLGLTDEASKLGTIPAIAAGSILTGLTGLGAAWVHNKLSDPVFIRDKNGRLVEDKSQHKKRYKLYGIGSAILGGILGSSLAKEKSNVNNNIKFITKTGSIVKKAFPYSYNGNGDNILFQLNQLINNDYTLNFTQKNELINQLRTLPTSSLSSFYPLIGAGAGAGIGYLIAKKLLGFGRTGTIIASILGLTAGLNAGYNAQPSSIPVFDPFSRNKLY
jgi:hypothetical protein